METLEQRLRDQERRIQELTEQLDAAHRVIAMHRDQDADLTII